MDTETGTATPRSPVSVQVRLRGHVLVQDKPSASGGRDEGPMASELLLASLLACQYSTFVKIAAKRRMAAEVRELDGAVEFDAAGDVDHIRVTFHLATVAEEAALATALRLTEQACTISKALRVPVRVGFVRAT